MVIELGLGRWCEMRQIVRTRIISWYEGRLNLFPDHATVSRLISSNCSPRNRGLVFRFVVSLRQNDSSREIFSIGRPHWRAGH